MPEVCSLWVVSIMHVVDEVTVRFKLLAPVHAYIFGARDLSQPMKSSTHPVNSYFVGWLKSSAPNVYAYTGASNLKSTVGTL